MAEVKIYCGDKSRLPGNQGYSRFGTRNECLKCGFGSAMYKYRWAPADEAPMPPPREREGCLRDRIHSQGVVRGNQFLEEAEIDIDLSPPLHGSNNEPRVEPRVLNKQMIIAISIWFVACAVTFVLMYTIPPSFVITMENQKKVINWSKFIGIYFGIVAIITAIVFGFYYALIHV